MCCIDRTANLLLYNNFIIMGIVFSQIRFIWTYALYLMLQIAQTIIYPLYDSPFQELFYSPLNCVPPLWHSWSPYVCVCSLPSLYSTTTYDMLCVVDLLLDFNQHNCNTQRNQEVAALILFPQAVDPTAPEDSTICSITQSLLFWDGGDKYFIFVEERERNNICYCHLHYFVSTLYIF